MAILSEKGQKCFGLRRKDVRMRAIICDDDGRFAKKLEQLIMQYYRNMGMTIDTTVVTNPQNLLKRNDLANFDIAFLDADMKPIDGIEVGRALRKRKPKIIIVFVSAYLEFAPQRIHNRCISLRPQTGYPEHIAFMPFGYSATFYARPCFPNLQTARRGISDTLSRHHVHPERFA